MRVRSSVSWVWLLSAASVIHACGSSDQKKRAPYDGNGGGAGMPDVSPEAGQAPDNSNGGAAGTVQGAGGMGGVAELALAGAAGEPPITPPTCNETCPEGACVFDVCLGTTTLSTSINVTTTPVTEGRLCAEAPEYAVTALTANSATLAESVVSGCLNAGDEVLLINLQGRAAAHENVGVWETLRVLDVQGSVVKFTTDKLRSYGAAAGSDSAIGTAANMQRVALMRVPRFGVLDITNTGSLTANAWDGQLGGVVALRAGKLRLAGAIDASQLGYRGGRWSEDNISCWTSLATECGESISGPAKVTTNANEGASGGLGAGTASFNSNTPVLSTPGHALAGEPGTNNGVRTLGAPGAAYGRADGSLLTMGSGPGGGLECTVADHPVQLVPAGGQAGGIVLLLADEVTVADTGRISASPPTAGRDTAFAGGYVLIRGQSVALGVDRVTARGSLGKGLNGPTASFQNHASPGYITVDAASVTGSTDPQATLLQP